MFTCVMQVCVWYVFNMHGILLRGGRTKGANIAKRSQMKYIRGGYRVQTTNPFLGGNNSKGRDRRKGEALVRGEEVFTPIVSLE